MRLLLDVACNGWCGLSYFVMYNMSTFQTVSMCFTTSSCFMLPHYEWCWWILSFLYFCLDGLLDDIVIVLGAETGDRSFDFILPRSVDGVIVLSTYLLLLVTPF